MFSPLSASLGLGFPTLAADAAAIPAIPDLISSGSLACLFGSVAGGLLAATDDPGAAWSFLASTWLWVKVALGIGLVIFVHELGHFLAAKLFGVKCEKFYIGFDVPIQLGPIKLPRTFGKVTYGETEYGIGILPLGGYVKMLGQDDDPRKAEEEAQRIRVGDDVEDEEPQLDPRSYPAKPVWQRMIIISAGVVMNVITGALFAAIAYFNGVGYTPAVVGEVTAGGPAWQAGIQPGGQVVSVAGLEDDDQLHFNEMTMKILYEGLDAPDQPVNVRIAYDDEVREYQLTTKPSPIQPDRRMIGIQSASSATLPDRFYAMPESVAASVLTDEDAGATVTAVQGKDVQLESPAPATEILARMYSQPAEELQLTLLREEGGTRTVSLPPQPAKHVGVTFEIGPIVAIQEAGPAAEAGLQVGDQIVAINGDRELNAYDLILSPPAPGESVELTVRRGNGSDSTEETVALTARDRMQRSSPTSPMDDWIASDLLGLAYRPTATVAELLAAGTARTPPEDAPPASGSRSGEADTTSAPNQLQAGDVIRELRFYFSDPAVSEAMADRLSPESIDALKEGWELGPSMPLTTLMETIQLLPVGTKVGVKAVRPPDGRVIEDELVIGTSERYWYDRGLNFAPVQAVQYADSLGAAVALGLREGKRRMLDVAGFLGMLVRGRVKAKYVGGPIRIVQLAGAEAERGVSAQLLFLTMLSMNLAILNFLPIPALDGGHMLFLIAEAIRGRRLDEAIEMRLTFAGVLALLGLMIFVFANDLLNLY